MFSEVQRDYVKHLYITNHKQYPYYLAYTQSNVTNTNVPDNYNFYVILSPEEITANNKYSYNIPAGSKLFKVRSSSASYNYHNERVVNENISGQKVIDNYEFVYTNATFEGISLQPDVSNDLQLTENTFNGFGIAILIVLLTVIVARFLRG